MHDLVVLDNTTVGVVVNVEADALRVLTNQARAREGGGGGGWGGGGNNQQRHRCCCRCVVAVVAAAPPPLLVVSLMVCYLSPTLQGRPDKPDIRMCRLPDIKRKMDNRRASVRDGGACAGEGSGEGGVACWGCHRIHPAGSAGYVLGGGVREGLCISTAHFPNPHHKTTHRCSSLTLPPLPHPPPPTPPGGNDVGVGDAVDVVDGPLKGRSGTVRYIMRGFVFVQVQRVWGRRQGCAGRLLHAVAMDALPAACFKLPPLRLPLTPACLFLPCPPVPADERGGRERRLHLPAGAAHQGEPQLEGWAGRRLWRHPPEAALRVG